MGPAVSSPEVEWKCKCAVKPLLPPGRVRRPPEFAIGRARSERRSPQRIGAARGVS